MKYNPISRRLFLQGTGGALFALPLLPSLVTKALGQTLGASPKRLVSFFINSGSSDLVWFPTVAESEFTHRATEYKAARVADVAARSSTLSPILSDPRFKTYANYMNIYRGVDGSQFSGHSKGGVLSGHWFDPDIGATLPMNASIDYLASRKIYASEPAFRLLQFGVKNGSFWNGDSISFGESAAGIYKIPCMFNPIAAFDTIFKDFAPSLPGRDPSLAFARLRALRMSVLDTVFEDYRRVRQSAALSSSERVQLDEHVERFRELEKKIATSTPPATGCSAPTKPTTALFRTREELVAEGDFRVSADIPTLIDIMSEIIIAAFKCNLTRVATFMLDGANSACTFLPGVTQANHSLSHTKDWRNDAGAATREQLRKVHSFYHSKIMNVFERLLEVENPATGERFIDNTLIIGTNEMGTTGNHRLWSMPVFTLTGMPAVNSGWYVDYRTTNRIASHYVTDQWDGLVEYMGRDYNSFLIGTMVAMGLTPPDWERGGKIGFGNYQFHKGLYSETLRNGGIITTGRRSAMPFMLKT